MIYLDNTLGMHNINIRQVKLLNKDISSFAKNLRLTLEFKKENNKSVVDLSL